MLPEWRLLYVNIVPSVVISRYELRPLRARHVVRNSSPKALVQPNERFLTFINCKPHCHPDRQRPRYEPRLMQQATLPHESTRYCNDLPCRNDFPQGVKTPGRRNVLHSVQPLHLQGVQDASPFWHLLRTPPHGGYTPDPHRPVRSFSVIARQPYQQTVSPRKRKISLTKMTCLPCRVKKRRTTLSIISNSNSQC